MRAAVITELDGTPAVRDFADPAGREGLEVVEVLAAGLNPVDLRIATGTYGPVRVEPPYVVGREAIVRLPGGGRAYVDAPPPPYGCAAERTLAHPELAIPIPEGLDDGLAVSLGVAGLAAWLAVQWRGRLQAGDRVLVLGATGVVGLIAVQAARVLGAGRVVAAGRDAAALERARHAGADAVVRLAEVQDAARAFEEAAEGRLDVVIDPLWGAPALAAMHACAPFARLVQLGQSAGAELALPSAVVRNRPIEIVGHTNGAAPAEIRRDAYEQLVAHAAAGAIDVPVERVALDDVASAWQRQRESPGVKLVLVP